MTPNLVREWLRTVMDQKGLGADAWARQAGIAPSTLFRALKPGYQFTTSNRTLMRLAQAADVPPPNFSGPRDLQIVPKFLPVRFKVQAGLWYETDDYAEGYVSEHTFPVAPDPRFADWPQWLERVFGDSVNKKIPDGSMVHVVDAIEMGYAPRHDDFVVVERRRAGGQLRERTVKQVEKMGRSVKLWPRSTNEKWSEPVCLTEGAKEGEDIEVQIVGLVVGVYTSLA